MKTLILLALMGAPLMVSGQSLPDCRTPELAIGAQCSFLGTTLPVQRYLGNVSLPSSDHVRMTEPFVEHASMMAVEKDRSFSLGAMFTVQTETFGYKRYVSDGFKLFATKQWSDWRGVDIRGTVIESGLGIGIDPGKNHTLAVAAGPRIQHSFGPVTPYGEALLGALYQYAPGMSESGVAGASVRLGKHLAWIPVDAEYRYASFQQSSALENPRRGRIELSSGIVLALGNR